MWNSNLENWKSKTQPVAALTEEQRSGCFGQLSALSGQTMWNAYLWPDLDDDQYTEGIMRLKLFIWELYRGMFQLKLHWVVAKRSWTLHLQRLNKIEFYFLSYKFQTGRKGPGFFRWSHLGIQVLLLHGYSRHLDSSPFSRLLGKAPLF